MADTTDISDITEQARSLWKKLPDMILENEYEKEIKQKMEEKIRAMNNKAKNRKRTK